MMSSLGEELESICEEAEIFLGKKSKKKLEENGVKTLQDLKEKGPALLDPNKEPERELLKVIDWAEDFKATKDRDPSIILNEGDRDFSEEVFLAFKKRRTYGYDLLQKIDLYELQTDSEKLGEIRRWLDAPENRGDPHYASVCKMVEQGKQLNEQREELNEQRKELYELSLASLQRKFPALIDCTTSGPYYPSNHAHADVRLIDLPEGLQSSIQNDWMTDQFWKAHFGRVAQDKCDSELWAQTRVVQILQSVLLALGLERCIELVTNRTIAGAECDILLVFKPNRLPFAALEVKKPCISHEQRQTVFEGRNEDGEGAIQNRVAGEIFDELNALRLFGFKNVTGMITTANHWRLVGLDYGGSKEDNEAGKKDSLSILQEYRVVQKKLEKLTINVNNQEGEDQLENTVESEKCSPEQGDVTFDQEGAVPVLKRAIWGSKIVPSLEDTAHKTERDIRDVVEKSGTKIISLAVIFVLKACVELSEFLEESDHEQLHRILVHSRMPCRLLKQDENVFAFGTVNLKQLNLGTFNPDLKLLHVIRHLGMGGNGNCCLAASSNGGSCCVVKFFHNPKNREKQAKEESDNWNKVYEKTGVPLSRVMEAADDFCMVMPYLHPIPKAERHHLLEKGKILEALKDFAKSGFIHNDIKWRHLGRWKGEDGEKLRFMDLGDLIKAPKSQKDLDAWCNKANDFLTQSAGEKKAPMTPQNESKQQEGMNAQGGEKKADAPQAMDSRSRRTRRAVEAKKAKTPQEAASKKLGNKKRKAAAKKPLTLQETTTEPAKKKRLAD